MLFIIESGVLVTFAGVGVIANGVLDTDTGVGVAATGVLDAVTGILEGMLGVCVGLDESEANVGIDDGAEIAVVVGKKDGVCD